MRWRDETKSLLPPTLALGVMVESQIEGVLLILIGLGYRHFSGQSVLIPLLARCVIESSPEGCKALAAKVCAAGTSREVRELLGVPAERPWGLVSDKAAAGEPGNS